MEDRNNNFTMGDVLADMVSGATLHKPTALQERHRSYLLVWPEGRTKRVSVYVSNTVQDCDFLDVVHYDKEGSELCINDEGRRWLAEWQAKKLRVEAALLELYPTAVRRVVAFTDRPGWLDLPIWDRLKAHGIDPDVVDAHISRS